MNYTYLFNSMTALAVGPNVKDRQISLWKQFICGSVTKTFGLKWKTLKPWKILAKLTKWLAIANRSRVSIPLGQTMSRYNILIFWRRFFAHHCGEWDTGAFWLDLSASISDGLLCTKLAIFISAGAPPRRPVVRTFEIPIRRRMA